MSPEMDSRRSGIAFHQSEDSFSLVWRLPPRAREGLPEPGLSWSLSRVSVLRWPPSSPETASRQSGGRRWYPWACR